MEILNNLLIGFNQEFQKNYFNIIKLILYLNIIYDKFLLS